MTTLASSTLRSLALSAMVVLGGSGLARAERVEVHYGVTLIGLPIGSATVTSAMEPSGYKIEANAKLSGLASILSSSHGAATASGVLVDGQTAPNTYATTSANATMTRTIRMAMTAGSVTGIDISPPFDPQVPRVPISEADKRGIVDPLSAFVIAVPGGGAPIGPAACNRTLPIFDGGVRFDIVLTYVGTRHAKTRGFDGDVAECSARYRPISGHRMNGKAAQFMADNKDLDVWLAPVAGTRFVFPFRISVRTLVGTTVIEADAFAVDATHASVR